MPDAVEAYNNSEGVLSIYGGSLYRLSQHRT